MEDAPTLYPAKMPDGSIVVTGLQHASEIPRNTFGAEPTHVYACVSDRPIAPEQMFYSETSGSGWEIDEKYVFSGAVYLGELTSTQYAAVAEDFSENYKGQYVVQFDWEESFPPTAPKLKRQLAHAASAILNEDQKKVLNIVLQIANNIRTADGCGDKNVQFPQMSPEESSQKTEDSPKRPSSKGKERNADDELRHHLKKHPEDKMKTSVALGDAIGKKDATIRKTATWKALSQERESDKKVRKIVLQIKGNARLSKIQRDVLEKELKNHVGKDVAERLLGYEL